MKEKLQLIFNHFGEDNQLEKLREECTEFLYAYERYRKYGHKNPRFKKLAFKEIEDISVVGAQFNYNIPEISNGSIKKVDRTIERIESGYYDK